MIFNVPHEKLIYRNFVLFPLQEIVPNWIHPITKEKISNLIEKLPSLNIVSDKNLLEETIKISNQFKEKKEKIIVFGTGGSNLGARALNNIISNNKINKMFKGGDEYETSNGVLEIKNGKYKLFDSELNEIQREIQEIDWEVSEAEKSGYDHFMYKEILEQSEVIERTLSGRLEASSDEIPIKLNEIIYAALYEWFPLKVWDPIFEMYEEKAAFREFTKSISKGLLFLITFVRELLL